MNITKNYISIGHEKQLLVCVVLESGQHFFFAMFVNVQAIGHERFTKSTVVGNVFAKRQLTVNLYLGKNKSIKTKWRELFNEFDQFLRIPIFLTRNSYCIVWWSNLYDSRTRQSFFPTTTDASYRPCRTSFLNT